MICYFPRRTNGDIYAPDETLVIVHSCPNPVHIAREGWGSNEHWSHDEDTNSFEKTAVLLTRRLKVNGRQ